MDEPTRFAILIGINDYKSKPLNYCCNDVELIRSALISHCKFLHEHVQVITSSTDHPLTDMVTIYQLALTTLEKVFKKGDILLFYFSGHGHFDKESLLDFHDVNVSVQSIYDRFNALRPASQIYILDACYSGYGVELKSTDDALRDYYHQRFEKSAGGIHFLCSSRFDQKSVSLPKLKHSVYTYNIVKAMRLEVLYVDALKSLALEELHLYASKRILLDYGETQTPFLYSKSSGYLPFAFLTPSTNITATKISIAFSDPVKWVELLENPDFNFPEEFKNDFTHFFYELSLNLFKHNYSTKVELSIHGNNIEIYDYSKNPFDPFIAETTADGNGVRVYKLFLSKYADKLTTSYHSGPPNVISMNFSPSIFDALSIDPCHIVVDEPYVLSSLTLNKYDFDPSCSDISIDLSKSTMPLSFVVRELFDYLDKRTLKTQMIILKMRENDLIKETLSEYIQQFALTDRFLLV